jgi:hypothetical protein
MKTIEKVSSLDANSSIMAQAFALPTNCFCYYLLLFLFLLLNKLTGIVPFLVALEICHMIQVLLTMIRRTQIFLLTFTGSFCSTFISSLYQ